MLLLICKLYYDPVVSYRVFSKYAKNVNICIWAVDTADYFATGFFGLFYFIFCFQRTQFFSLICFILHLVLRNFQSPSQNRCTDPRALNNVWIINYRLYITCLLHILYYIGIYYTCITLPKSI